MLSVKNLSIAYGQHQAVSQLNIKISPSEVVVILGANGAGKSSLLRAISGLSEGHLEGDISFAGETLLDKSSDEIVNSGIALVPEGRAIFGDLSVEENLILGAFNERARDQEQKNLKMVLELFPKLRERRHQIARTMSGGEQQMVAIGRALMSDPTILMLDEPSLGLSPLLSQELFQALGQIRKTGIGVLVVEQNAKLSLSIADRGYLIENGRIVGENDAKTLASDPAVQRAYLGAASPSESPVSAGKKEAATQRSSSVNLPAKAVSSPLPPPVNVPEKSARPAATASVSHPTAGTAHKKPRFISPQNIGAEEIRADQLIPEDVNSLVNRAARTATDRTALALPQSTKDDTERPEISLSSTPSTLPTEGDLEIRKLLADFETSAKNARNAAHNKPAIIDVQPIPQPRQHQGPLPAIPVFRKSRVEIYKRNNDGQLVKSKEA